MAILVMGKMKNLIVLTSLILLSGADMNVCLSASVRVKDISKLAGVVEVRLIGYGLVVGLDRTGDSQSSLFTNQSLANMLERFGIAVDGTKVRSRNVAAVMVTADVPPFSLTGNRFDVTVSSLGDSKSLSGGILLQTTLSDLAGQLWAIATGPVAIGGFSIQTEGMSIQENHPVVGRIPGGGVLRKDLARGLPEINRLTFSLDNGDFTTVRNMADAINISYDEVIAIPIDGKTVTIDVPAIHATPSKIVNFIATIENVEFVADISAKVVINERTGTIVIGNNVSLSPVAICHGSLSITIKSAPVISQALAFAPGGKTVTDKVQEITVEQRDTGVVAMPGAATVGEIASLLNRLGVNPREIIAIFQALKQAGAWQAELVII